jgi:hypothetical protein
MGSPWRDSGLTSPVSRDCVSGASPCDVVFSGPPGIVDLAAEAEAIGPLPGYFGECLNRSKAVSPGVRCRENNGDLVCPGVTD